METLKLQSDSHAILTRGDNAGSIGKIQEIKEERLLFQNV